MDDRDAVTLSGWRVVELLWPLNDMFRARLPEMAHLKYDPAREAEADEAIKAYAERPEGGTWAKLDPEVWRVLLERHRQLIRMAEANEVAGNPMISLPAGLSRDEQRVGLMLIWLLRMKLPYAVGDRSRLELPARPPGRPPGGH